MKKRRDRDYAFSRQQALRAMGPEDGQLILAYAMLVSLADDLALLRVDGFWDLDPNEMLLRPGVCVARHRTGGYEHWRNGTWLLKELQSEAVQTLYGVIAAVSNGRLKVDRGTVVRLARRASEMLPKGPKRQPLANGLCDQERRAA